MRLGFLVLSTTAIAIAGCGGGGPDDMPEIGQVTGVITVDGVPKADLMVTFQPEGGRPAMGTTDAEGKYELTYSRNEMGTKIGKNLVTISTVEGEQDYEAGGAAADKEPAPDPIPAKYNTMAMENPEMTVEVSAGSNEFNFDVSSGG